MKRILVSLAALSIFVAVALGVSTPARPSLIVGRDALHAKLQVDSSGHALVSYTQGGKSYHVLVWGAINAVAPTRGRQQTAFKIDYSGGYKALHKAGYYKTIKSVCKPYDGPKLAWYVPGSGCKAPDGSYWALQAWQRELPDLGFKPWKPEQSSLELHISHWKGPLAQLKVYTDWAWGGRFHQLFGQLTYLGKPVYGFGSTSVGAPTDSWGRNNYLDTFDSPYGKGWARENSFLAQSPQGGFCYSFGPRPPYAGYPASPPRQGNGKKYRVTVLGPGVTPIIMWQGNDPGDWNKADPAKVALEAQVQPFKAKFGLSSTECHS